jgi:hypothetical protein
MPYLADLKHTLISFIGMTLLQPIVDPSLWSTV